MPSDTDMRALDPTVLVVEDHSFQRSSLCRLLRRAGAGLVLEAADGDEALKLLRERDAHPIMVITDLDMPNVDGIAFIRHVATEFPHVSLAIHSAQDPGLLRTVRLLAEELGLELAGVLSKPARLHQIEGLLAQVAHGEPAKPAEPPRSMTRDDIREAFTSGWVVSHFQPKVCLADGKTVGCEALARIVHPRLGVLAPSWFMTALQAAGLGRNLTNRMLESAGVLLRETRDVFPLLSVSVNLTLPEVSAPQDAERLTNAVQALGVAPDRIIFEVTEGAMATDWTVAVENLARLKMRGFALSIDDFGTGYSSLQQLLRLPFSELKLDRSFISGIGPGSVKYALVEGTIRMARKLSLTTVAEGIELPTEAQTLLELGCDMGQGYAFSRPLDHAHLVAWLRRKSAAGQEAEVADFLNQS